MKVLFNIYKRYLKLHALMMIIAFAMLLPVSAFCQEEQPQQEEQQLIPTINSPSDQSARPIVGASPWANSAGSAIGTRSTTDADVRNVTPPATSRATLSRPGVTLADPGGGGPGGNPDVPFDKNMNIAFLIIGAAFAFWTIRKRITGRALPLNQNR